MFDETLFDKTPEGVPLIDLLKKQGIVPGIKVDAGQAPIAGAAPKETSTQGLDKLGDRCAKYYAHGARFAKWRAVIIIDPSTGAPTQVAIDEQTRGLARYASICQANGLVPIVEPEVLMDGEHPIEVSAEVTERVWAAQFKALAEHHVLLEGIILKPNMVRSGASNPNPAPVEQIAAYTVRTLMRTVPPAVPGITFLSGGMSEEEATQALNHINLCPGKKPWSLSFSYGRALQKSVLMEWKGQAANKLKAQQTLVARAKANGEAQQGIYKGGAGGAAANQSSYIVGYSY